MISKMRNYVNAIHTAIPAIRTLSHQRQCCRLLNNFRIPCSNRAICFTFVHVKCDRVRVIECDWDRRTNTAVCTFVTRTLMLGLAKICRDSRHTHTHIHTRWTALFSRTTRVSRYQKGKTNLDFTKARDSEWQWHRLQTDNRASNSVFYRHDALPAAQPTASKHWRDNT